MDKGFKLFPPNMKKRDLGRQKKKRHLAPSERSGKATRHVKCPGCGEYGHRSRSWRCSLTGTKKGNVLPLLLATILTINH